MAPDGSYVDLSKVVCVSKMERLPSSFTVIFGFDIYFTPTGIPFKQDNCFKICIAKQYDEVPNCSFKPVEDKTFQDFLQKCKDGLEQERLKFVEIWKEYKSQLS